LTTPTTLLFKTENMVQFTTTFITGLSLVFIAQSILACMVDGAPIAANAMFVTGAKRYVV